MDLDRYLPPGVSASSVFLAGFRGIWGDGGTGAQTRSRLSSEFKVLISQAPNKVNPCSLSVPQLSFRASGEFSSRNPDALKGVFSSREPTACPGVKLVFIVQSLSRVQLIATLWTDGSTPGSPVKLGKASNLNWNGVWEILGSPSKENFELAQFELEWRQRDG